MNTNYILGAGPAGLIAAYYNEDYKVVDEKPLGQLNMPFIPGPRLLQSNQNMKWFVKEIANDLELKIEKCVIGYHEKEGVYDSPDENFKKKYSMRTRGNEGEGSHLSEGKTEIMHCEVGELGEDSYKEIFTRLLKIIEERGQLIKTSVKSINTSSKTIEFTNGVTDSYDEIISTLNINILRKICSNVDTECTELGFNFETTKKSFYKCSYGYTIPEAMDSKHPSLTYDYIYSIHADWTRCTFFKDYIVYESTEPIEGDEIEGNKIEMKFENLPIQIKQSYRINEICGIVLLGRFAEWNHKIKANEVLDKVKEWID